VLGFSPGERLTTDMVKKRHRELARQHHPDVGGSTAKMQDINRAVDELMASGTVIGSNPGPAHTWDWKRSDTNRNPPNVLPVPGQRIRSWDYGDGSLNSICEVGRDGLYTASILLDGGRTVAVPLTRTEYDFAPRKALERRTGLSRHEQFIGPPQPGRLPKGTPVEFDDTIVDQRGRKKS
jgi:hypothetical protein